MVLHSLRGTPRSHPSCSGVASLRVNLRGRLGKCGVLRPARFGFGSLHLFGEPSVPCHGACCIPSGDPRTLATDKPQSVGSFSHHCGRRLARPRFATARPSGSDLPAAPNDAHRASSATGSLHLFGDPPGLVRWRCIPSGEPLVHLAVCPGSWYLAAAFARPLRWCSAQPVEASPFRQHGSRLNPRSRKPRRVLHPFG